VYNRFRIPSVGAIMSVPSDASGQGPLAHIERLCREGRMLALEGERALALSAFLEAWELLPEPKDAWDTSTYILASVGDLLRAGGELSGAIELLLRSRGRTASGLAAASGPG
jgi:hypothetical protein